MRFTEALNSLYTRTLLIFILGGFFILLTIVGGGIAAVGRTPEAHTIMSNAVGLFVRFIADDLGNPPETEKVLLYAKLLGVNISVEQNGDPVFSTAADFPLSATLDSSGATAGGRKFIGIPVGRYDNRFFVWGDAGNTRLIFWGPKGVHLVVRQIHVWIIFSIVALLMIGCTLLIHKNLKPLRDLNRGVSELARADFKTEPNPLPVYGSSELAGLANRFNNMANQIHHFVKAKEQLLYDISHELRTPVTRARLSVEEIEDADIKKSITEDLKEIEELTAYILESARLDSPFAEASNESFSISPVVLEVCSHYLDLGPGVKVSGADRSDLIASGSPAYAKIVLKNLIDNACKYSASASDPVHIALSGRDDFIEVTVRDYGPGIPAADLPFVFEPFFRVDRSRSKKQPGFGLGLGLSRKLMTAQGGDLRLESKEGEGTTVTAYFRKARIPNISS